jgi:hypothetical protein
MYLKNNLNYKIIFNFLFGSQVSNKKSKSLNKEMENRIISMFGFTLKKEYVLNKIKEHLNYEDEFDFSNLPETFKEVLENHLNIQDLNSDKTNLILTELKEKIFSMNNNSICNRNIGIACKHTGELAIGYVFKESITDQIEETVTFHYNHESDNSEVISLIEELKEFVGIDNIISSELSFFDFGIVYDTSKYQIIPKWKPLKSITSRSRILDYFTQTNRELPPNIFQYI